MQKKRLLERNTPKCVTPLATYTLTLLLVALCFVPLTTACQPEPQIQLQKTGPTYAYVGDPITYTYLVSNPDGQPLSDITVTDDRCGPVCYVSGDHNHNDKLEHSEVWTYTCTTTPDFSFPEPLTNTATVTGTWQGQTAHATAQYTLYPFILRKAVLLYWEGDTVDYADPDTSFTIQMSKKCEPLATFTISESAPKYLWLSEGKYHFTELNVPDGYLPAYDTITITTGQTYPDFSALNIITFDLSVEKTGPATCHPHDHITYSYIVHNSGPASVTPLLQDDLCGTPVYVSGDSDADGLIDPCETWSYQASYTVNAEPGSIITNIVHVTDAEGANRSAETWWLGGDVNQSNDVANWSVTVIPCPEEPNDANESGEQNETDEPQEPGDNNESGGQDQNESPGPTTLTVSHGPSNHYGDIAPLAVINGPYNALEYEVLTFDGSQSSDPDGFIIRYHWDFGDGTKEDGKTVTHSYDHKGVYLVTLTVTDNYGMENSNTTTATITAPDQPPANLLIGGPANGTTHIQYTFVCGSIDEDDDDITYHIDWGDGTTTQTESYPSGLYFFRTHQWAEPGEYIITLTASDGTLTSSAVQHINIQETSTASNIALLILALIALLAIIEAYLLSEKKKNDNE
jgi:PKD repeat protein